MFNEKNDFLISDSFLAMSFRTFCITKGCFPVIMKKNPLVAKDGIKGRTKTVNNRSAHTYSASGRHFVCNFTYLKKTQK